MLMLESFMSSAQFMYELLVGNPFWINLVLSESDVEEDDWNTAHLIE